MRLAPEVGGRLIAIRVQEGDRVQPGMVVAVLDPTDLDLALRRARAELDQARAARRLLVAGARPEDLRQAEAELAASEANLRAARAELAAAETELARLEAMVAIDAASRQQEDTARMRRDVAAAQVRSAEERVAAATAALDRLRAGARREELEGAAARVAAAEAQVAALEKDRAATEVRAPVAGVVTERFLEPGELVAPRTPILVLADLERAWANVYLDEPLIGRVRLGQPATLFVDGISAGLAGTVTFISPRAEFTPRNVQTREERAKLVYRLKVTTDNRAGLLKPGMPVEAEVRLQPVPAAADPSATGRGPG